MINTSTSLCTWVCNLTITEQQPVISELNKELAIVVLSKYGCILIRHLFTKRWFIKLNELPVSIRAFNLIPFTKTLVINFSRQQDTIKIDASVLIEAVKLVAFRVNLFFLWEANTPVVYFKKVKKFLVLSLYDKNGCQDSQNYMFLPYGLSLSLNISKKEWETQVICCVVIYGEHLYSTRMWVNLWFYFPFLFF